MALFVVLPGYGRIRSACAAKSDEVGLFLPLDLFLLRPFELFFPFPLRCERNRNSKPKLEANEEFSPTCC